MKSIHNTEIFITREGDDLYTVEIEYYDYGVLIPALISSKIENLPLSEVIFYMSEDLNKYLNLTDEDLKKMKDERASQSQNKPS